MATQNVRIAPLKGHGTLILSLSMAARFAYRGVTGFILFRHTLSALKNVIA